MRHQPPPETAPDRVDDSPVAWFVELVTAKDRGEFTRAATAQDKLARLGWTVRYRKPRPGPEGGGR